MIHTLAAIVDLGLRELRPKRLDQLVCLHSRLALLIDLQQRALLGCGCARVGGLDGLPCLGQIRTERILRALHKRLWQRAPTSRDSTKANSISDRPQNAPGSIEPAEGSCGSIRSPIDAR